MQRPLLKTCVIECLINIQTSWKKGRQVRLSENDVQGDAGELLQEFNNLDET